MRKYGILLLAGAIITGIIRYQFSIKDKEIMRLRQANFKQLKDYEERVAILKFDNMTLKSKMVVTEEMLSSKLKNYNIIFNPHDVTQLSNLEVRQAKDLLRGTELEGLEEYYIQAEKMHKVNAVFLMALTAVESGWGGSDLAKQKGNLSGFMAYNYDVSRAKTFNSKGESIITTARVLERDYLSTKGMYYNGKAIKDINIKYSQLDNKKPNYDWTTKIKIIGEDFKRSVK